MSYCRTLLIGWLLSVGLLDPALGQDVPAQTAPFYWNGEDIGLLGLRGDIDSGAALAFRRATRSNRPAILELDCEGGDVNAALVRCL